MLECREYSYQELCSIFNTRDARSIKNRLTRWKVEYNYEGRGANLKFTIQNIHDPFRVFCILELSYAPNTGFPKTGLFPLLLHERHRVLRSALHTAGAENTDGGKNAYPADHGTLYSTFGR